MKEWADGPDGLFSIFDAVECNYFKTFLASDIEDNGLREKVYHRINALKDLRKAMELVIAEGRAADAIIEKLSKANTGRRTRTSTNVA